MGRLVKIVAILLFGGLLPSCGDPTPRYNAAALKQVPETKLFAPNSEVIRETAQQAALGPGRPGPARYGYYLGTAAAPEEVEAFYRKELAARGWAPYPLAEFVRFNNAERAVLWQKGDLGFQLTVFKAATAGRTPGAKRYATDYAIIVTEVFPR